MLLNKQQSELDCNKSYINNVNNNILNSNFIFRCSFSANFIEKIKIIFNNPQKLHNEITIPFNMLVLLENIIDDKYENKNLDTLFELLEIMNSLDVKKEFIIKLLKYHKLNFHFLLEKIYKGSISETIGRIIIELYVNDIDEELFFTSAKKYNIVDKTDIIFKNICSRIKHFKNKQYKDRYFKLKKDFDNLKN